MYKCHILMGLVLVVFSSTSMAGAIPPVKTISELKSALNTLNNGVQGNRTEIVLAPGDYELSGTLYAHGLKYIIIRSQYPNNPAVIKGGEVFRLSQPEHVTIKDLVIQDMSAGGLNIDDVAGVSAPAPGATWTPTLAHDITLKNIKLLNIGNDVDNNDGIKLTGIDTFTIENVQVINWGGGGSGVDMVGCHNGTIKNSLFRSRTSGIPTGIVAKGGSERITINNNRFELETAGVAVKLGGSTGNDFFRFLPDESERNYEAKNIEVSNNTILDSRYAVSYVNISEGGVVKDNLIYHSMFNIARILDEQPIGGNIFPTRNGEFTGNTVVFDILVRSDPVNIGPNTDSETFDFSNNKWFKINLDNGPEDHVVSNLPGTASGKTSGNIFGVGSPCGTFDLPSGQWRQISLPCEPQGNNAKILALFADDIGDPDYENYGDDWVIYRYDATEGEYQEMGVDWPLSQGEGYWIIQVTGEDKTLSMPVDSLPVADGGESGCLPLQSGCFNISLGAKQSATQWNMIGYPYKTSQLLSKVRVITDTAPCKSPGCNLVNAEINKIVHNRFWTYDGSGYKPLGSNDSDELDPWTGYWSPTLSNADGKLPELRFQRP